MTVRTPRLSHWMLLGVLTVLWGSAFAGNEVALESFSPASIVAGRVLVGAMFLVLFMRMTGRRMPRNPRDWRWIVAMAVLGNAVPFYLIAWGQQSVDSGMAGILMAVMPLMVIVLAHRFIPGERINVRRLAGMLAGLIGVILLLGADGALPWAGQGSFAGRMAILGGAMLYAINVVLARLAPPMDSTVTATGVTLTAAILIVPVALLSAPAEGTVEGEAILAVILLGVLATSAATVIYFEVVRTAGPAFLSLINYLVPAWAVLVGAAVLGESLSTSSLSALAIILGGVLLSQRRPARSRPRMGAPVVAAGQGRGG